MIYTVEQVLLVTLRVYDHEFRRIQESARVQPSNRDEVAPLCSAKAQIEACVGSPEAAVGSSHAAMRRRLALARTRRHVDYDTRLVAVFGGRCPGDDLQRLNRINRNLVGKRLTKLVCDWLIVHGERVLRMVSQAVKQPIGVCSHPRRSEGHERTNRRRSTLEG